MRFGKSESDTPTNTRSTIREIGRAIKVAAKTEGRSSLRETPITRQNATFSPIARSPLHLLSLKRKASMAVKRQAVAKADINIGSI